MFHVVNPLQMFPYRGNLSCFAGRSRLLRETHGPIYQSWLICKTCPTKVRRGNTISLTRPLASWEAKLGLRPNIISARQTYNRGTGQGQWSMCGLALWKSTTLSHLLSSVCCWCSELNRTAVLWSKSILVLLSPPSWCIRLRQAIVAYLPPPSWCMAIDHWPLLDACWGVPSQSQRSTCTCHCHIQVEIILHNLEIRLLVEGI